MVINSKGDSSANKFGKKAALAKHGVKNPVEQAGSVSDQKKLERGQSLENVEKQRKKEQTDYHNSSWTDQIKQAVKDPLKAAGLGMKKDKRTKQIINLIFNF